MLRYQMSSLAFALVAALSSCTGSGSQPGAQPTTPTAAASATAPSPAKSAPLPACHDRRVWGSYLRGDSAATIDEIVAALGQANVALASADEQRVREALKPIVKWRLIRFLLVEGQNHNFGAVSLPSIRRADGAPLQLFRSGFTTRPEQPGSCFRSLLETGEVRHVVNLYAGVMPTQDLETAERSASKTAGASYFTAREAPPEMSSWRYELEEHGDDPKVVRSVMERVARLINQQILRPGGQSPQGNVHLHCGGGMHRTGMLVGILQRCINQASMAEVERDYKHHVDWQGEQSPGGYEAGNLQFIESFDCSLLQP